MLPFRSLAEEEQVTEGAEMGRLWWLKLVFKEVKSCGEDIQ